MKNEEVFWTDCQKWRERREVIEQLPSGDQGDSFRVRRVIDGRIASLKTIRAKTDPERRARFFREASAYDTFHVDGAPCLIESNAHRHDNSEFERYLATEFVEGPTPSSGVRLKTKPHKANPQSTPAKGSSVAAQLALNKEMREAITRAGYLIEQEQRLVPVVEKLGFKVTPNQRHQDGAPDKLVQTFLSKGAWRTAFRCNLDLMERTR